MKKALALAFVICMVFSFCSCAQETEEVVPDYVIDSSENDYLGASFTFVQRNEEHSSGEEYCGYVVNTEFADLALQRMKDVEKELNVKITINSSGTDINTLITSASTIGEVPYDAVQAESSNLANLLRTGFLYDLTLSDKIDYRNADKFGTVEDLKPLCWNDGLYGVIPAAWPIHKFRSVDGAVVVNEDIISRLSQTDPREFVENDEWTWSKLEELMPVYTHVNDAGDTVVALQTTVHWLFRTMHTTNGEPVVIKDGEGNFQLSLHSPITFDAMQTAWNWSFGEYSSYVNIDLTNNWTAMLQEFIDGKSVLTLMNGTDLCGSEYSIAYKMDNYGVVPFPHGPNGTADYTGSTITTTRFSTGIPVLCKDPEMAADVLNAIFEPLPGYETEESIIDFLRKQYFFDDRDVNNFVKMYKTEYYNYRHEGVTDVYININRSKSMSEWLEQFAAADQTNKEKYIDNMEKSAETIFG